jgi:predicted exporter
VLAVEWTPILQTVIAAVPTTILAGAAWITARRGRSEIRDHMVEEGVTSEAILRGLEALGALSDTKTGDKK